MIVSANYNELIMSAYDSYDAIEIDRGRTILEEGEEGHGFYILQSGSLEVYKQDMLLSVLMYPGTIFGEMGDILGKPRSCTVRAKTTAKIIHVPAQNLEELIRESPEIALKIIKTLASRLERTTQKLVDQSQENSVWAVER